MIHGNLTTSNKYNQNSAAEANETWMLAQSMPIKMQLNQIDRHKEITAPYLQDPGSHILKICYRKANKIWETIELR